MIIGKELINVKIRVIGSTHYGCNGDNNDRKVEIKKN